ncbi:MAG: molybdopterin-dependent oxidoreductase [Actinobacteria bacterium]|nr:molybdopterin-dependent oxidoreductase [Actinomycetota bacterium]
MAVGSGRAVADPVATTVQTLCRMCDDRCGIEVHVQDGRVVDLRGNDEHPWSHGRLCVKARAAVDVVEHPDRLRRPLKRTPQGWQEIPLEQALDEIAGRLRRIIDEHGARSVSVWKGEAVGFAQQEDLARRFIHALGSPNYLSNDSMCWVGRYIGHKTVLGSWPVVDIEHARCVVMWGANPPYSRPNLTQRITAARRNGASLIAVDPRLSAVARRADIHVAPRPGTDGALALGLIREIVRAGTYDREFVRQHTVGFDELVEYADSFTPEVVEEETGVPEATLRSMARVMCAAEGHLALYAGNGLEHHENGVNNIRAIVALNALLGTPGRIGGALFEAPLPLRSLLLYDELPHTELGPLGADRFPVLYDVRQECHTMTALDAILSGDPYPLRAMLLTAANPMLTNPDTARVRDALAALDLLVVRDLFMTETAALADYVLPAASFMEREEVHTHHEIKVVTLTRPVFSLPEAQTEYQFWHDLAHRLGCGEYFPWDDETALDRWLLEPTGISLEDLAAHPEGMPYGAPRRDGPPPARFASPSGKVELVSAYLRDLGYDELPVYRRPAYLETPDADYPHVLITGARQLLFAHSRGHNVTRFSDAMPAAVVEMHPDDAAALGLEDGATVEVTSRIGSVRAPVRVVAPNEIVPGCLQMTHGWADSNANLVTHDDRFDPVSGFPLMKSVEVRVSVARSDGAGRDEGDGDGAAHDEGGGDGERAGAA